MKKGFTLVELSIVLVIIGLLIGGILVGQSLIESAKVNKLTNDLHQYEIATTQFRMKFKKYPGDSPNFTPPGTGNNILSYGAGGTIDAYGNGSANCANSPNASLSNTEYEQFWAHLSQSKMLSKNYPAYSPQGTCGGGIHNADWEAAIGIAPYTDLSGATAQIIGRNKEPIFVGKDESYKNLSFQFFVSPLDLFALQNKLGSTQFFDNNLTQIGLALAGCYNSSYAYRACNASDATWANVYYFVAP